MLLMGNLLRRMAQSRPNKIAVVFEDTQLSFRELNDRVNQLANALSRLGVRRGDRVGLLMTNSHFFEIIYFAVIKIGAILVPVNFWYKAPEVSYVVNKSGVSILIVDREFWDMIDCIQGELKTVKQSIGIGENPPPGIMDLQSILAAATPEEPQVAVDEDDPHLILFTSGTTGIPKGAVISHKNYFLHTGMFVHYMGIKEHDIYMNVYPMFHMGGLLGMHASVYIGATLIIVSTPPTPPKILGTIQKHRVTHLLAVPTLWKRLLEFPQFGEYDLVSLELAMGASDSMPKELLEEVLRRTPAACPQLYGLTEGGILTYLNMEESTRKIGSSGRPHSQAEIRLVDEDGRDVPMGQVGEIICRGEHQMSFYWDMPEETKNTIRQGWLHTGDLGRFDEEGYLYIVGRKKDMIISGGQNIYPAEIEKALHRHSKIEEAAVVGIPDREWGEAVVAVVVLRKNEKMSEEELVNYIKENMASYNKPRYIRFVEALPRTTATGKLQKAELRKKYAEEIKG